MRLLVPVRGVVGVLVAGAGGECELGGAEPFDEDVSEEAPVLVDVGLGRVGDEFDVAAVEQLVKERASLFGVALARLSPASDLRG